LHLKLSNINKGVVMQENIYQKAYEWSKSYPFEAIEIDYASRLALKMLDDSCNMGNEDRKLFFYVYDALCDREDLSLDDPRNELIQRARDRETILSKAEYASEIHDCKEEVMQSTQKVDMKRFKKMVRENLGLL